MIEDLGTVSSTALYLLKTLTEDKLMSYNDIQMVPCCGHFLIANNDLTSVTIIGCDKGMDWSTVHTENGKKMLEEREKIAEEETLFRLSPESQQIFDTAKEKFGSVDYTISYAGGFPGRIVPSTRLSGSASMENRSSVRATAD